MRAEDWPQRLGAVIEGARTRTFAYGTFDCALFAADCVLAMTEVDYAAELRGYKSKLDAYRIVVGYGSLEAMITALLGREPKHPSRAGRGDVVLATIDLEPGESGDCIGICVGPKCVFPRPVGVRLTPRTVIRLAWSID